MMILHTAMDAIGQILDTDFKRVICLLVLLGLFGGIVVTDFGESIDEWHNAYYGELFLDLYDRGTLFRNPDIDYYNGPFYFMLFTVSARLFRAIFLNWQITDGRHLTNWITFLVGAYFLFDLARRHLGKRGAWFSLILFLSQPLLIGHAFINLKDAPFMSFFIVTMALGFRMIDAGSSLADNPSHDVGNPQSHFRKGFSNSWKHRSKVMRVAIVLTALATLAILIDLWGEFWIYPKLQALLEAAYRSDAATPLQNLFDRVATDAYKTPLVLYLEKLDKAFLWSRALATAVSLLLFFKIGYLLFSDRLSPAHVNALHRSGPVILAGISLGLTSSIRLAGPLAGLLISVAFLLEKRDQAIMPLVGYWSVALVVMYATWPAIWGNPFSLVLERVQGTVEFTSHTVLYQGRYFESRNLPWHYLPTLFGIQLTVPALLLALLGIVELFWKRLQRFSREKDLGVLSAWVLFPALMVISGFVPVYNNTRHLLFIVPALLLFAASGMRFLFERFRNLWLKYLLLIVVVVPGLTGIFRLHPYEYLYYNELAGGLKGASGTFALDYWCVSMREVVQELNTIAGDHAEIAVDGALTTAQPYARDDLELYIDRGGGTSPDFGIGCNRRRPTNQYIQGYERIFSVDRDGVVLSYIEAAPQ